MDRAFPGRASHATQTPYTPRPPGTRMHETTASTVAGTATGGAPKRGMVFMMTRRRRRGSGRGFTPSSMRLQYCVSGACVEGKGGRE